MQNRKAGRPDLSRCPGSSGSWGFTRRTSGRRTSASPPGAPPGALHGQVGPSADLSLAGCTPNASAWLPTFYEGISHSSFPFLVAGNMFLSPCLLRGIVFPFAKVDQWHFLPLHQKSFSSFTFKDKPANIQNIP